jgi:hypothetical protein
MVFSELLRADFDADDVRIKSFENIQNVFIGIVFVDVMPLVYGSDDQYL